mmetsp:Transcript_14542/g.31604  ORF Transcript_14542/g.31604 Transcript_14542/m.31604 type:complete len:117 (+) Transcript_14542:820-1170(+)
MKASHSSDLMLLTSQVSSTVCLQNDSRNECGISIQFSGALDLRLTHHLNMHPQFFLIMLQNNHHKQQTAYRRLIENPFLYIPEKEEEMQPPSDDQQHTILVAQSSLHYWPVPECSS